MALACPRLPQSELMPKCLLHSCCPLVIAHLQFNLILCSGGAVTDISGLTKGRKLLKVVENWLRNERAVQRKQLEANPQAKSCRAGAKSSIGPIMPSKHLAFYR